MSNRSRAAGWLGSGRVWMMFWIGVACVAVVWGLVTVLFLLDSVRNLNAISVVTFVVAALAGIQSTLGMRKSDPEDPL